MDDRVTEVLSRWGIPYLFPYQELVIRGLLDRELVKQAVLLPTGAGKSLCFQLPAALLPDPTLVVYPLRSLTSDQKRRGDQWHLPMVILQGGQTRQQRQQIWDQLARGRVRMVLTNPETLEQPRVQERLAEFRWSHAVIDEAHCVELWGTSFRPSYRTLGSVLSRLSIPRITAFTATASERIVADWKQSLFAGAEFSLIRASADRPNLDFSEEPCLSVRKSLPEVILRHPRPTVVFCRSREQVRRWAHHLYRSTALDVRFYHAGLRREEKAAVESWFLGSGDGVLVATNAYGMGVDKPNIRTVVHLGYPGPEDYLQEAGRAGRDGAPARAIRMVPALAVRPEARCRRETLLEAFGEEAPACSGCDVCRGQHSFGAPDGSRAWSKLEAFVHRLTRQECIDFLSGRRPPRLWESDLPSLPGWGLWKDEDDLTIRELWRGLEAGGWVRFHTFGPWKGLLAPRVHGG